MSSRSRYAPPPVVEGYSAPGFYIMMITLIVIAIILIVVLVLYFRRDANLIQASECPEQVVGVLAIPGTQIQTVAENCGNVGNCTIEVSGLEEATAICGNLGLTKCAAFSLQQQPLSDLYVMTVSESTATNTVIGSDTYRLIL